MARTTEDAPAPGPSSAPGASRKGAGGAASRAARRAGDERARRAVWARRAALAVVFLGIVLVMLRPGWHSIRTTVPNLGDPVFLTWAMSWGEHALVHQPHHLFDANIFWPHTLQLARSESLFTLVPAFALLRALGAGWALTLNLLALGLVYLGLWSTYGLARWLTGRTDAAALAGIAFMFSSFTFVHQGHTQLLMLGSFPLAFLALFRWLEVPTTGRAAVFGLATLAMLLGALYYTAIYLVSVGVILAGHLIVTRLRPGAAFPRGLAVVVVISAVSLPVLLPYSRMSERRPILAGWSLRRTALLSVAPGSYLYPGLDTRANANLGRGEDSYFPGFSTLVLAGAGAAALVVVEVAVRRRRARAQEDETGVAPAAERDVAGAVLVTDRRRYVWMLLAAGAASALLALGPSYHGVAMPFTLARDHVPGFSGIRVPARIAVPALLAAAVLAAMGFAAITSRLRAPLRTLAAVLVGAFMLLELAAPVPSIHVDTRPETLAVYHALARRPPGAVVELPVIDPTVQGGVDWAYVEAPRMMYSTIDWKPRFNGYSGSNPAAYPAEAEALDTFPSPRALDELHRLGIRYVVLHVGETVLLPNGQEPQTFQQYTEEQAAAIVAALPPGARATRHGNAWLVDLGPGAGR